MMCWGLPRLGYAPKPGNDLGGAVSGVDGSLKSFALEGGDGKRVDAGVFASGKRRHRRLTVEEGEEEPDEAREGRRGLWLTGQEHGHGLSST
jgi:hypothetical protein